MAFVSDVKCGKCDRRYSGLRARCPYCGARRGKAGKHANQRGNSTGKLIVGLILILLLIAAVVFLILTGGDTFGKKNADADKDKAPDKTGEKTEQNGGSIMGNDEDVTTVDGSEYVPAEQPEDTGEDAEAPEGEDGEMTAPEEMTFPWTGTVKASSVRVRKGAGTSYDEVNYVTSGQEITVLDQIQGQSITDGGESSDVWYKIEYTTNGVKVEGFLNSLFVAPKN